jgi:methylmalonyl-CoA mutase
MSSQKTYLDEWQRCAQRELGERPLDELYAPSLEGILIKPLYTAADLPESMPPPPGLYPYTRGIRATMYANKPWTIRQYAGFSSAKESNAFYRDCLKKGQKGLSIAFDLPTHRGYDSDDPLVMGDVGKAGVAIDSVLDMHTLFSGIDLRKVSVSMTMNGAVLPVLAAFIVAALERGVEAHEISGTIQNDILKEFLVRNTFIYPPEASLRIVADVIEYCAFNLPKFNSISISGYHIHEAGADLGMELGLTLADGLEYVECAIKRGIEVDLFLPRLSFFFATGMNFFMEIAKLRAARQVWAEAIKKFNPKNSQSLLLRTHCQTSGWSLAAQDPYNNIVRTTIEALASVLGGTQSLHTNSFDEAIALPTPTSARIARNTQLIIEHESNITKVVDPLGGSYYVEYLTKALADRAKEIMVDIKKAGGMAKAINSALPIRWIEEAAVKRQALIDSEQEVIVGVNKFALEQESPIETLVIDNDEVVNEQKASLKILKAQRDNHAVSESLRKLTEGAKNEGVNLLELGIDAMRNRATVGEVSLALEKVFGRYEPSMTAASGVYRAVYDKKNELEQVASEVRSFAQMVGRQPRILLAKLGQDGHDRGAKVIASAFADFGFDVDISPLFQSPKSLARQAVDNDVHIIGVSTLAGAHNSLVPELISELKKLDALDIVVTVGGVVPPIDHQKLYDAGVSLIFGPGTNTVAAARQVIGLLKEKLGQRAIDRS